MRYGNGEIQLSVMDLSSGGFGATWGHTRVYNNRLASNFNYGNGWNWMVSQWAYLVRLSRQGIAVVRSPRSTIWFNHRRARYVARYGAKYRLVHIRLAKIFRMFTPEGEVWDFHDFDQALYPQGFLKSVRTAGGQVLKVVSYHGRNIEEIQREADGHTESFRYAYNAGGLVTTVTLRRKAPHGAWVSVRRVVYEYYGSESADGLPGDLKLAKHQEISGTVWRAVDTYYYRYWVNRAGGKGFKHGLKYTLGPDAFRRLSAAVSDPFTASDTTVAQYADSYFEYGVKRRVTKEVVSGGTLPTELSYQPGRAPKGYNQWRRRTVETRNDGSEAVVFTNYLGQVLLRSLTSGSNVWNTFNQYDHQGRLVLSATPAAVDSYSYTDSSLTVTLKAADGLIQLNEYYHTTDMATGAAAGYLKADKIQKGSGGTPIKLREYEYTSAVDGRKIVYPRKKQTEYRNDDGTGAVVTEWAYTFHASTVQMKERTTTLPAVLTTQNGLGTSAVRRELFDIQGNLIATQDERGYINTYQYNVTKGVMTRQVQDDDPPSGSGWTANAGTRLKLTSDFEYDSTGRQIQSLGPSHDVNGQSMRTAQWTVRKDLDRQTYSGSGYVDEDGNATLVNPVSITQQDAAGLTSDSIQAVRSSTTGPLTASDSFPQTSWCRWTRTIQNSSGHTTATRVYHDIPSSGEGSAGTNYDETTYGYDAMDRQNMVENPAGTITRTVYDVRGLVTKTFVGTDDSGATDSDPTGGGTNDMRMVTENHYDNDAAGGNGNLTQMRQPVDDTSTNDRVTNFLYDWRDRQTDIDGEIDFYLIRTYDNLNRVTQADRRNTTATGGLIARSQTFFDDRGQVYQKKRYAVNPGTGAIGNALIDNSWFDAAGNVIKSQPAGSQRFTKTIYDSMGRASAQYQGYYTGSGSESNADAGTVTSSNKIFQQALTTYDQASQAILISSYQRFHNASGNGVLNSPSSEPKARISYQALWYDGSGRSIAAADYGTNSNSGTPSRPDSPPSSGSTVLVSTTVYNDCGEAYQSIDPAEMQTTSSFDDAGRVTQTVVDDGSGHLNITTQMTYDASGQLATLTAVNSDTGDQTTTYTYGVTLSGSNIASKDLLASVQYPAAVDSSDRVSYEYNRQSQRIKLTDQNGTIHQYDYDKLGRLTQDRVTTLGTLGSASIDGAVRRLGRSYEVRGLLQKVTSYDNATVGSGSVVNEVQLAYNDFQQLTNDYQAHSGAVNISTSPQVQYGYANGSANTVRRTQMSYPNSSAVAYEYGTSGGDSDRLSRVADLTWNSAAVCQYTYMGIGSYVQAQYLEPSIEWNAITGSGSNPYAAWDIFGRTTECRWQQYGASTTNLVQLEYGYDQASNRLWRQDDIARGLSAAFDELYAYDTADRLTDQKRGTLDSGHTSVSSQNLEQSWTLDATGNWKDFSIDLPGTSNDLTQTRTHNAVNEITAISQSVGPHWPTPTYDRAGNTIGFPVPISLASSYAAKYDAWNRLVQLKFGSTVMATMAYDGQNRRTTFTDQFGTSRHYYYSDSWQVLEERLAAATAPDRQFVWGTRYVDDLVLRDRFVEETSSSSSGGGGSGSAMFAASKPRAAIVMLAATVTERLYALQDANWNMVALSDTLANVAQRFAYTAYGVPDFLDASYTSTSNLYAWETLFTGQRYEIDSGLYLYRMRYYHPNLGRFVTRDPIGYDSHQTNLYTYAQSSPVRGTDYLGLIVDDAGAECPETCLQGIAAISVSPPKTGKPILKDLFDQYEKLHPGAPWYEFYYRFPIEVLNETLVVHSGHTWIWYDDGAGKTNELSVSTANNWLGSDVNNPDDLAVAAKPRDPPEKGQVSKEFFACPQTIKKLDDLIEDTRKQIANGKVIYNIFNDHGGIQCVSISVDTLRKAGFPLPESYRWLEPYTLAEKLKAGNK